MDTPKKMQKHMTVIRHALECYCNDSLGGMTEKGQEYYREGKAIDEAFDSIQEAIDSLMGGKMISPEYYRGYICTNIREDDQQCGSSNIHRAMFCFWDKDLDEWVPESNGAVFPEMEYWCRDCDGHTEPEEIGGANHE